MIQTTGTASRFVSIFLRLGELTCGAIVLGLLGRAFYLIGQAGVDDPNGRLVFATVIAALTVLHALFFMPPLGYVFWFFPIDFFFFVAWLVVFCLLETLTGINTCNSDWYVTYWGYYWGRWYTVGSPGINVNWTGCSAWRTVLAFSFVASFIYLISFFLGIYWTIEHGEIREKRRVLFRRRRIFGRRRKAAAATGTGAGTGAGTGGVVSREAVPPAATAPTPAAATATGPTATTTGDAAANV